MSCIWQASVLHCQPHYVVFIGTCINQNLKVNRTLSSSVFSSDELKSLLILDVYKAEVSYLYN